MTLSQEIAEFIFSLDFEHLPAYAVSNTKDLIVDHIGVSAYGSTTAWGGIVAKTIRRIGGIEESSLYFTSDKIPALNAGFVNGTFAHAFELDDFYNSVHPGSVVIPAALALGEREAIDGRTLITAIVLGYEILQRLALAMPHISSRGYHPTGTFGPFGAAVAAGKILGLNRDQLVSALGLAGNFPTGVCEFYRGTMEKRVFAGRACQAGILACLLAQAGITAASTIFEGEYGFCRVFSENPDLDKLTIALGERFHTEHVYLKRYASAGRTHPYIDAALALYEKESETLNDVQSVDEIRIEGPETILNKRRSAINIGDVMAAQYSIPYAVSVTLCNGRPGIRQFSEDTIRDSSVQYLLGRCRVVLSDESGEMGELTVNFKNGSRLFTKVVDTNPSVGRIGRSEIANKFFDLTSALFEREQAQKIMEATARLEELGDVRDLTKIMVVPGKFQVGQEVYQ